MNDTLDDPKGKETKTEVDDPRGKEAETKELEILGFYDGETLIVLKETTPNVEKKWLWKNIFLFNRHSTWAHLHSFD